MNICVLIFCCYGFGLPADAARRSEVHVRSCHRDETGKCPVGFGIEGPRVAKCLKSSLWRHVTEIAMDRVAIDVSRNLPWIESPRISLHKNPESYHGQKFQEHLTQKWQKLPLTICPRVAIHKITPRQFTLSCHKLNSHFLSEKSISFAVAKDNSFSAF